MRELDREVTIHLYRIMQEALNNVAKHSGSKSARVRLDYGVEAVTLEVADEGRGLGKSLLQLVVDDLRRVGHSRIFLGCAADPAVRSYGFYRHLGWVSTGTLDQHGDEILELPVSNPCVRDSQTSL